MMLFVSLLAGALTLALVMAIAWVIQNRSGNAGWVDASWSFGVGFSGAAGALAALTQDETNVWRVAAATSIAMIWGLRLGGHIFIRSNHNADDPRYAALRAQWGADAPRKMFWFLQQQAWGSAPLVWAIILAAWNPSPDLRLTDIAAIIVAFAAIAFEHRADQQLRRFIANPANRGRICDEGLWSYSRHPNYFFQWLGWLAWPLMAISWNGGYIAGWLSLLAPVLMYIFLVRVTGIPPLEEHMLRKHGEKYRAYQRSTPAFFPAFLRIVDVRPNKAGASDIETAEKRK